MNKWMIWGAHQPLFLETPIWTITTSHKGIPIQVSGHQMFHGEDTAFHSVTAAMAVLQSGGDVQVTWLNILVNQRYFTPSVLDFPWKRSIQYIIYLIIFATIKYCSAMW